MPKPIASRTTRYVFKYTRTVLMVSGPKRPDILMYNGDFVVWVPRREAARVLRLYRDNLSERRVTID